MQVGYHIGGKGIQGCDFGTELCGDHLGTARIKLWLYEYNPDLCLLGNSQEPDQFLWGRAVAANFNGYLLERVFMREVVEGGMEDEKFSTGKGF